MKKLTAIITAAVSALLMLTPVHAYNIGDYIGTVYYTDIVAYINNYAIPSYAANGTSVVVAEDLRNFGFDVIWDNDARTLSISRNDDKTPTGMEFVKDGTPSMPFTSILYTDIVVYANGEKIPSYAINGYTMIPMESLTMLGEYEWVPDERALKMWVDGLDVRSEKQEIMSSLQYGRSIKPGAQNLISGLSAQQRYELNVFLSNFLEIDFPKYDAASPVNSDLIYFGCMHNACNHTANAIHIGEEEAARYVTLDDNIHSCYKVSKETVEADVMRYFGKKAGDTLNHSTATAPNMAYRGGGMFAFANGYYYFDYGEEGDTGYSVAIADSMYLNNDGSYTVTFKGYGYSDLRLVPEVYYQNIEQAEANVQGTDAWSQGTAIINPFTYNGRDTYQLVTYSANRIWD